MPDDQLTGDRVRDGQGRSDVRATDGQGQTTESQTTESQTTEVHAVGANPA
jgi:hypothetical protein